MSQRVAHLADKSECTGCGVCKEVCPVSCISFNKDTYGFYYPVIDEKKCINCGSCNRHCPVINSIECNKNIAVYAGKAKEKQILKNSASGGAFSSIASWILRNGGIVYGCYADKDDGWKAKIVRVDKVTQLNKIQGSKYYESNSIDSYKQVKEDLDNGLQVIYGARPCQVSALYSYLGNNNIDNLITVDLVCHGVSSLSFFRDYITDYETKHKCKVVDYRFRAHKRNDDRGYFGEVVLRKSNGRTIHKPLLWQCDSYYYNYMMGTICRESCFSCRYSRIERIGDISLGDFWGIDKIIDGAQVGNISLVLANSNKGRDLIKCVDGLEIIEVDKENATKESSSLYYPATKPTRTRAEVLKLYDRGGWHCVESSFKKRNKKQKVGALLSYYTPSTLKKIVNGFSR